MVWQDGDVILSLPRCRFLRLVDIPTAEEVVDSALHLAIMDIILLSVAVECISETRMEEE